MGVLDVLCGAGHQITVNHCKVRQLADLQGTLDILIELCIGRPVGKGTQGLLTGHGLFNMPAALWLAQAVGAGHGCIDTVVGVYQLDRSIGAVGNHTALVQNGTPGIGPLDALTTHAILRLQHVRGSVCGLHRGQNSQADGAVNVSGRHNLEVLNAQTVVIPGIGLDGCLIGVDHLVVGAVTDAVGRNLITGVIGHLNDFVHLFLCIAVIADMALTVGVGFQHGGRTGTQRPIRKHFYAAQTEMIVV